MKVDSEIAREHSRSRLQAPDRTGIGTVVGIAVVASVCLVPYLNGPMFADEGATLYSAHLSWSDLWAQSAHVDLVLLPYYVLVHGWLTISDSIAWVRALSLLAYFGTIIVVGWLGLRIAGRWCGAIAAVLTATSTLLIEKALNARPYDISTFLVALCAVVLFRWLHDARGKWLWLFSGLSLLVAAMQLFSLLAPLSMFFCALAVRPAQVRQRVRAAIAPITVLGALSLVWVVACARELGQVNWIASESILSRLLDEVRGPAIGQLYDLVLLVIVAAVVFKFAAIWTPGVRRAAAERIREERDPLAVMVGWAVLPTVLLALASFIHPIYSVRYVAASAPGLALVGSFVLVRTFPATFDRTRGTDERSRTRPNPVIAIICVAAAVLLIVGYVSSAASSQEDLESPARYVAAHAQPGDALALPDHAITSVFEYYLGSNTGNVRLWPQLGTRQRYVEGYDLVRPSAANTPRRVWIVDDGTVRRVTDFAQDLVDLGYRFVGKKQFNGGNLYLFHASVPVTSIFVPKDGATLQGTEVKLGAAATSYMVGISRVQFVLSGGSLTKAVIGSGVQTLFGFYFTWNTTSVANGTYSLQSVATDKRGTQSYSRVVTITVANGG